MIRPMFKKIKIQTLYSNSYFTIYEQTNKTNNFHWNLKYNCLNYVHFKYVSYTPNTLQYVSYMLNTLQIRILYTLNPKLFYYRQCT